MQRFLLTVLISTISICLSAQQKSDAQATALLDKAAAKFSKTAYATDVKLSVQDPDNQKIETQNMSIKLSGSKFYIKTPDMETFFDGKTQWVHYAELNEVTISEPTKKELETISPTAVFKNYKNKYRVVFEQNNKQSALETIVLLPYNHNDDIFRIRVVIDKNSVNISKIEISQRNGQTLTFAFGTYRQITPNADTFAFSKAKYPNVAVNDLR
jgi:outer membrane lipoprotein-sorting protein